MKKVSNVPRPSDDDEMLPEYDMSGGVRGKYANRLKPGSNIIILEPDVAAIFPTSESVNDALRALAGIIRQHATVGPD